MRNTPAIIIHVRGLAHEQPPDGDGMRFSLGQRQKTPIPLAQEADLNGNIYKVADMPIPLTREAGLPPPHRRGLNPAHALAKEAGGCPIGP